MSEERKPSVLGELDIDFVRQGDGSASTHCRALRYDGNQAVAPRAMTKTKPGASDKEGDASGGEYGGWRFGCAEV